MTAQNYYTQSDTFEFEYCVAPKALFKSDKFRKISDGAKLLYIAILNRLTLSAKNGWHDEEGRVYVYYSLEDVCYELACSRTKAVKLFKELDSKNGAGLIERKRLGLGKTSIIFVPKLVIEKENSKDSAGEIQENKDFSKISNEEMQKNEETTENEAIFFDSNDNLISHTDCEKEIRLNKKDVSELLKMIRQEISESECNKNKINKNKINKNDFNYPYINQPIINCNSSEDNENFCPTVGWTARMENLRKKIRENISYETLVYKFNPSWLDEVVEVMANAICSNSTLRVKNTVYPPEAVKERYLSLRSDHIEYVSDYLRKNTATVNNPHAYLLAVLFQAPETMMSWYSEEVKKDGLLL